MKRIKIYGKKKNVKAALAKLGKPYKVIKTKEVIPILANYLSANPKMIPNIHRTKLVYEEDVTITASSTSPQFYVFACNDIYDPNVTGVGHQPYYHDQLAQLYNRYDVTMSNIKVQYYQPEVVNNNLSWMRVFVSDTPSLSALAGSIYAFRESPLGSPCAPVGHWDFDGMFNKSHVEHSWSLKRYVKQKDENYGALFGSHPQKLFYYVIGIAPPTGSDGYLYNHEVRVRIEFNVICSQPKLQGVS